MGWGSAVTSGLGAALAAALLATTCSASTVGLDDSSRLPPPFPPLVPLPAAFSHGSATALLGESFQLLATPSNPFLEAACSRYRQIIFRHAQSPVADKSSGKWAYFPLECFISELLIVVKDPNSQLSEDTDESYTLSIPACSEGLMSVPATAVAQTQFGALRALETFSQLVTYNFERKRYVVMAAPWEIKVPVPVLTHHLTSPHASKHLASKPKTLGRQPGGLAGWRAGWLAEWPLAPWWGVVRHG